jgi:formamidopyrimidine-DNA glycosylase
MLLTASVMAELPRVETFRKLIDTSCKGRTIAGVFIDRGLLSRKIQPYRFRRRLTGKTIGESTRHGKLLFIALGKNKGWLIIHFGTQGFPQVSAAKKIPAGCVLCLEFSDRKKLCVINERRIGEIGWTDRKDQLIKQRSYGYDALLITEKQFMEKVRTRRTSIKAVLTNQNVVAGVGNAYADEILFRAGVHPQQLMHMIPADSLRRIYHHMRQLMREAISGKNENHFFVTHRKAGIHCPNCYTIIKQKYVQGRSTYFCPSCQP